MREGRCWCTALHRGIGNTKQNLNKEVYIYSRENNCGVVDRREIDGKKIEKKTAVEKNK